jgi:predicted O-methyltransferase YrrM
VLAESLVAPGGLVILDDVFNHEWPGVVAGFASYLKADAEFKPFAVSGNKTYLARPGMHSVYRALGSHVARIVRSAEMFGTNVDVWTPR